jgi:hypothetical protein
MATASEAKTKAHRTSDHKTIRRWAEARGGHPAMVEGTEILRFDFREPDEKLKQVSWDEFFRVFDDRGIEFLYQDETQDGGKSRFFKFVRGGAEDQD